MMETILHIQSIDRNINGPVLVGHNDYVSVGEMSFENEEEPTGEHAAQILVGSPLESLDYGRKISHIPIYKSFECMPDVGRPGHQVYLETIHYLHDRKYLIPVRSKIQSGYSQGLKISHIPSLNMIRREIGGDSLPITDNRSHILSEMIDKDGKLQSIKHRPSVEWAADDLIPHLDSTVVMSSEFNPKLVEEKFDKLRSLLINSSYEMTSSDVRELRRVIDLEHHHYPLSYYSKDVNHHRLDDIERLCVSHSLDLRSYGKLRVDRIGGIEYNPRGFQSICELIDDLPLTDFNIEIICDVDGRILFLHEHFAVHRLSVLIDHDLGAYESESLLSAILCERTLRNIRELFLKHHNGLSDRAYGLLLDYPIKMKIVKTIEDEACIILYESNSSSRADPLCGVYFDIALQSLSPINIIPTLIDF